MTDIKAEIRPNPGARVDGVGRCDDTDEVVGSGVLHVEQMDDHCFWARLELPDGKSIVMWFKSRGKIKLAAEWDQSRLSGMGAATRDAMETNPMCQCCDPGERCRGFCMSETEQPVAYAVFADNGNIRIWSKTHVELDVWAKDKGKVVTPLYMRPAPVPECSRRPIETAPKDGSHILAWRLPVGIRTTNNTHPPTVVHWFNDPDEPGFYTSVNERAPEHPFEATHWMPLPA